MKLHILIIITSVISTSISFAGIEQSIKYYTNGSLVNPTVIPQTALGLLKIRTPRDRTYATRELSTILVNIAGEIAQEHPKRDRLQIGDVANRKGGTIGQHKSHRNGLDADVVYYRKNNKEQDPVWTGSYVEKFVRSGKVTENFDLERNWKVFMKLASFPQVERVFVDIAIKKAFCKLHGGSSDPMAIQALRIMRPAKLHDDHMHIRITCPPGSPRCVSQNPTAPGTGCGGNRMELDLLESMLEEAQGC